MKLREQFIEKDHRDMDFGALPVRPRTPEAPIMPMDRWQQSGGALYKTYRFRRMMDRNTFVMQLLAYESSTEHNAELRIDHDTVDVKVQTKDIGTVTELDREYASYADVLFRGIVYNPSHADEG